MRCNGSACTCDALSDHHGCAAHNCPVQSVHDKAPRRADPSCTQCKPGPVWARYSSTFTSQTLEQARGVSSAACDGAFTSRARSEQLRMMPVRLLPSLRFTAHTATRDTYHTHAGTHNTCQGQYRRSSVALRVAHKHVHICKRGWCHVCILSTAVYYLSVRLYSDVLQALAFKLHCGTAHAVCCGTRTLRPFVAVSQARRVDVTALQMRGWCSSAHSNGGGGGGGGGAAADICAPPPLQLPSQIEFTCSHQLTMHAPSQTSSQIVRQRCHSDGACTLSSIIRRSNIHTHSMHVECTYYWPHTTRVHINWRCALRALQEQSEASSVGDDDIACAPHQNHVQIATM
jgi:hypothetical protein